jgi:phage-related protein
MAFRVDWDQDAYGEVMRLPTAERREVMNAVAKLEAFGDQLGSPHTSQVKGSRAGIRELRPRSGRSPWRALYRRLGTGWWCWRSGRKPNMTSAGSTGRCGWPRTD